MAAWFISSLTFAGTGMESVAFEEIVSISGASGPFLNERYQYSKDYHFQFQENTKMSPTLMFLQQVMILQEIMLYLR